MKIFSKKGAITKVLAVIITLTLLAIIFYVVSLIVRPSNFISSP